MNRSEDQFDAHRGLSEDVPVRYVGKPEEVSPYGTAGMHWTTNKSVARKFATGFDGLNSREANKEGGTILHAKISKDSTFTPGTSEWNQMASIHGVAGRDDWEKEVTVKPGKTVAITGVTHIRPRGPRGGLKSRKITFPPKEVQA